MENAGWIIGWDGIDLLFFGPEDMKLRMGTAVETSAMKEPWLLDVMNRVSGIAREAGNQAGRILARIDDLPAATDMGYTLMDLGSDSSILEAESRYRLRRAQRIGESQVPN